MGMVVLPIYLQKILKTKLIQFNLKIKHNIKYIKK